MTKYSQARSLRLTVLFDLMNGRCPSAEQTANTAPVHHHGARHRSRSGLPTPPSAIPLGVGSRGVWTSLGVCTPSYFF